MPEELIMRGQTASGETETLNFSGRTPGYAYQLVEFNLYPSTDILAQPYEIGGTLTAAKTAEAVIEPNYDNPGLIATMLTSSSTSQPADAWTVVINDLFYITQDLILMVQDTHSNPVNWQCRFRKVKLSSSAEAVANFNQFTIYDG